MGGAPPRVKGLSVGAAGAVGRRVGGKSIGAEYVFAVAVIGRLGALERVEMCGYTVAPIAIMRGEK